MTWRTSPFPSASAPRGRQARQATLRHSLARAAAGAAATGHSAPNTRGSTTAAVARAPARAGTARATRGRGAGLGATGPRTARSICPTGGSAGTSTAATRGRCPSWGATAAPTSVLRAVAAARVAASGLPLRRAAAVAAVPAEAMEPTWREATAAPAAAAIPSARVAAVGRQGPHGQRPWHPTPTVTGLWTAPPRAVAGAGAAATRRSPCGRSTACEVKGPPPSAGPPL